MHQNKIISGKKIKKINDIIDSFHLLHYILHHNGFNIAYLPYLTTKRQFYLKSKSSSFSCEEFSFRFPANKLDKPNILHWNCFLYGFLFQRNL